MAELVSRKPRTIDFMAGSERMLKVHHKNAVVSKSLEHKKTEFDSDCHKRLTKIQQEIYEVYFNEYLPLKEQSNQIRTLPKMVKIMPHCKRRSRLMKGNKDVLKLPKISHSCDIGTVMNSSSKYQIDSAANFLEDLRRRKTKQGKHLLLPAIPAKERTYAAKQGSQFTDRGLSACSLWMDSAVKTDDCSELDEKRLQIIKTAVALTSQPPKTPEFAKRKKRYRKSYIMGLRRQSRILWEEELLARARGLATRMNDQDSSFKDEEQKETQELQSVQDRKWKPSLSKNKIFNDDEDGNDDDMVFNFVDRLAQSPHHSVVSDIQPTGRSSMSDIPVHDIEQDLYHPETSPDIFSLTSETTGSSYSESFSSLEDGDTGSSYSFEDSYSD